MVYAGLATATQYYEVCQRGANGFSAKNKPGLAELVAVNLTNEHCYEIKNACTSGDTPDRCKMAKLIIRSRLRN